VSIGNMHQTLAGPLSPKTSSSSCGRWRTITRGRHSTLPCRARSQHGCLTIDRAICLMSNPNQQTKKTWLSHGVEAFRSSTKTTSWTAHTNSHSLPQGRRRLLHCLYQPSSTLDKMPGVVRLLPFVLTTSPVRRTCASRQRRI
jgi:hypothetical protein